MTILPKKKSSASQNDRDASGGVDTFPPRGLAQNQSVVAGSNAASGWGPGVEPSPSSPRWGSPTGSVPSVPTSGEKKRPSSSSGCYEGGPTASKRRHRDRPRSPASPDVEADEVSGEAADSNGGYNSEDEYNHLGVQLTEEEWKEKDRRFQLTMRKKGYIIKNMVEDGSCLFRAVADQIYGDQEMHGSVRKHCMDYIAQNSDYFSQYLTEDIADYVARKRYVGVHGNHLEIQALSEMYNRPIHIYCYSAEPINIFQAMNKTDTINAPIRLCYHRLCHYNSLVDPYKPTIGVGLGLPGYSPGSADRSQLGQAFKASESDLTEKAMLEDKIRATDWEATNEAIEEQVARESYLQWLRDNERRGAKNTNGNNKSTSATVTSADLRAKSGGSSSPSLTSKAAVLKDEDVKARSSPKPGCSHSSQSEQQQMKISTSPKAGCSSQRDSPKPCSSQQTSTMHSSGNDYGLGSGFELAETASFLNRLPPNIFGLEDWGDADVLTQVLAASQQEYLDSLKKAKSQEEAESSKSEERSNTSDTNNSIEAEHKEEPSGHQKQS